MKLITILFLFALASHALAQIEPRVIPGALPTNGNPAAGGGIYPALSGAHVASLIIVDGAGDTSKDVPSASTFTVDTSMNSNIHTYWGF